MPGKGKPRAPAAAQRVVIPLAAVTRRQARNSISPAPSHTGEDRRGNANPFSPLTGLGTDSVDPSNENENEKDDDGADAEFPSTPPPDDLRTRPRASSAPPTPLHLGTPLPSSPATRQTSRQAQRTTALLAQSPVRTRSVATGRTVPPFRRNVAFDLTQASQRNAPGTDSDDASPGELPRGRTSAKSASQKSATLQEHIQQLSMEITSAVDSRLLKTYPTEAALLRQLLSQVVATTLSLSSPRQLPGRSGPSYASVAASADKSVSTAQATSQASSLARSRTSSQTSTRATSRTSVRTTPDNAPSPASRHSRQLANLTRIFIRLPSNHPLRQSDPLAVRQQANAIPETQNLFKDAYAVASGFCLVARNPADLQKALAAKTALERTLDATVEPQESWEKYLLSPVPRQIRNLLGPVEVSPEMVIDEIKLFTGAIPRRAQWTRRTESEAMAHATEGEMVVYIPHDSAPPPTFFRIFGRQTCLRRVRTTPSTRGCKGCHQYHRSRQCRRPARCEHCGENRHDTLVNAETETQSPSSGLLALDSDAPLPAPCSRPARCINCRGPHAASHPDCPARPRHSNGTIRRPGRRQLQAIRAAGNKSWAAANPTATTGVSLDNTTINLSAEDRTSSDHDMSDSGARIRIETSSDGTDQAQSNHDDDE